MLRFVFFLKYLENKNGNKYGVVGLQLTITLSKSVYTLTFSYFSYLRDPNTYTYHQNVSQWIRFATNSVLLRINIELFKIQCSYKNAFKLFKHPFVGKTKTLRLCNILATLFLVNHQVVYIKISVLELRQCDTPKWIASEIASMHILYLKKCVC